MSGRRFYGYILLYYCYYSILLLCSLQKSLMELQQDQLTELGSWLTDMESKITSFNNSVQNIETLENVRKYV